MSPRTKSAWSLDRESFEGLLAWLDSDRDAAGRRYEAIRSRLIKLFVCRGLTEPEDLADETINRVARRARDLSATYSGDPALYFYGVANKVQLETVRARPVMLPPPPGPADPEETERAHLCLERCMERLPPEHRALVLEYYAGEGRAKIDHRREVARRLGIAANALRIRAHRIRAGLQACVRGCVGADDERGLASGGGCDTESGGPA